MVTPRGRENRYGGCPPTPLDVWAAEPAYESGEGAVRGAAATDILVVSGRAMLEALISGERDVHVLAQMAKARMRPKIPPWWRL